MKTPNDSSHLTITNERMDDQNHHDIGTVPGTLIAPEDALETKLELIAFTQEQYIHRSIETLGDIDALNLDNPVIWLHCTGLSNIDTLEAIAKRWKLHPLAMEDVTTSEQRPKIDDYGDYLFFVAQQIRRQGHEICTQQISLFVTERFVITIEEQPGAYFEPVKKRLQTNRGRLRQRRGDFLGYALVDALVDSYFPLMNIFTEELETLEGAILESPDNERVQDLIDIRRQVLDIQRSLRPTRSSLQQLMSSDSAVISEETYLFLRDVDDHTTRLVDQFETIRENTLHLLEVHMTVASQQMNEVMKLLTIISTIFIPLSFIVGLYGMNFNPEASPWNMPELSHPFGYPIVLGVMLLIVISMIGFLKHKRWL